MPRAADPSLGVHKLPLSKAKPLSGLEKGLSLIVSGVGGGRDARRKERQEQSRKQKEAEAVQERAPAVLKNLARVLKPANGGHKLGALAAAVKRGEALQEELPKDSKLRHQLAAEIEGVRAMLAALEAQQVLHAPRPPPHAPPQTPLCPPPPPSPRRRRRRSTC